MGSLKVGGGQFELKGEKVWLNSAHKMFPLAGRVQYDSQNFTVPAPAEEVTGHRLTSSQGGGLFSEWRYRCPEIGQRFYDFSLGDIGATPDWLSVAMSFHSFDMSDDDAGWSYSPDIVWAKPFFYNKFFTLNGSVTLANHARLGWIMELDIIRVGTHLFARVTRSHKAVNHDWQINYSFGSSKLDFNASFNIGYGFIDR